MMTSIQPSYGLPSSASANPKYEPPYKRSKVSSGTWVVRNVRENTFDPDEYALKSANVFEQVLQSVFSGIPLPGSLTKLTVSKRVETIVRLGRGYSFTLYTQMRRNCQAHVNIVLKSRLIASLRSQAQNGAEFASLILQAWEDWSQKLVRRMHSARVITLH